MALLPGTRFATFVDGVAILVSLDDLKAGVGVDELQRDIVKGAAEVRNNVGAVVAIVNAVTAEARADVEFAQLSLSGVAGELATEIERAIGQEGTLHSLVTTAESTAAGALSLISTERVQRADDVASLGARITTLSTTFGDTGVAITSEIAARSSADQALGLRINTVSTSLGAASSDIASETASRLSADQALGGRVDTVTSRLGEANAAIVNEALARVSSDGSLGSRIDSVTATAGANNSAIGTEIIARTNSDSALGLRIEGVQVTVGNNAASIGSEIAARGSADQALSASIASLRSSTDSNLASINQTLVSQSSSNSSFAGSISSLTSSVGGHSSTLSVYGQTLIGLSARWGVEFNAQGMVSGFALNNGSGRTDASFLVNTFKIAQPGAPAGVSVFNIRDDGVVEMPSVEVQRLRVGSVDVNALALGAVQKAAFYTMPSDIAVPRGATAAVGELTFIKDDNDSILEIQMFADVRSVDDLQFEYAILLNGGAVKNGRVNIILDRNNSDGQMPITPFMFLPGIGAGQHTISFRITNRETDNVNLTVAGGATLKVNQLRKGSIGNASGSGGTVSGGGGGGPDPGPDPNPDPNYDIP